MQKLFFAKKSKILFGTQLKFYSIGTICSSEIRKIIMKNMLESVSNSTNQKWCRSICSVSILVFWFEFKFKLMTHQRSEKFEGFHHATVGMTATGDNNIAGNGK